MVRRWIHGGAQFTAELSTVARATGLRALYTERVVPDEVLARVGALEVSHGAADASHGAADDEWAAYICRSLLLPDDHPTLSRFFTFRVCVDKMLTMQLVGFPANALVVRDISMRAENQQRLKKVVAFFGNRDCDQALRRSSQSRPSNNKKIVFGSGTLFE